MAIAEIVAGVTGVRFAKSYRVSKESSSVGTVVFDPYGNELKSFFTHFETTEKGLDKMNNRAFVFGVIGTGSIGVGLAEIGLGISGLSGSMPDMSPAESSQHIAIGLSALRLGIEFMYRSGEARSKFNALIED